jgi:hypothetical protein
MSSIIMVHHMKARRVGKLIEDIMVVYVPIYNSSIPNSTLLDLVMKACVLFDY